MMRCDGEGGAADARCPELREIRGLGRATAAEVECARAAVLARNGGVRIPGVGRVRRVALQYEVDRILDRLAGRGYDQKQDENRDALAKPWHGRNLAQRHRGLRRRSAGRLSP